MMHFSISLVRCTGLHLIESIESIEVRILSNFDSLSNGNDEADPGCIYWSKSIRIESNELFNLNSVNSLQIIFKLNQILVINQIVILSNLVQLKLSSTKNID